MFLFFLAQFLQKKVFIIRCPLFYHIDLKEKLERTQEECSGLQEKRDSEPHEFNPSLLIPCFFLNLISRWFCFATELKTELAQKIMKLNRTEDSKAALSESGSRAVFFYETTFMFLPIWILQ